MSKRAGRQALRGAGLLVALGVLLTGQACRSIVGQRFAWDVVVDPEGTGAARFQCTADGWAAGPVQPCPAAGCTDRRALLALCRQRFTDAAVEGARVRRHLDDTSYLEEANRRDP